jgi:hypothetical protein
VPEKVSGVYNHSADFLGLMEGVSLREGVPVHQAASDLCGIRPLVRTCAANQIDFAVTLSRSRSTAWVFFEFVSCAFAGCRANKLTAWQDHLFESAYCDQ